MGGKIIDLVGFVSGKLTVIERAGSKKCKNYTRAIWKCQCECGNFKEVTSDLLRLQKVQSCGCSSWSYGSEHRNFNPDLTLEERILGRHYTEYAEWRKSVFKRDNFTCKCCKHKSTSKNKLHSHHILNYSKYPDLRVDINNGITLCVRCHKDFHKIYNTKNNNMEQLEEFITNYDKK